MTIMVPTDMLRGSIIVEKFNPDETGVVVRAMEELWLIEAMEETGMLDKDVNKLVDTWIGIDLVVDEVVDDEGIGESVMMELNVVWVTEAVEVGRKVYSKAELVTIKN